MQKLPQVIPGEGSRTLTETIGRPRTKINPKFVAQRTLGSTVKSVVKKGIRFGVAGAALTGLGYLATGPSRRYNLAPKVGEDRDLRVPITYRGLEDFE